MEIKQTERSLRFAELVTASGVRNGPFLCLGVSGERMHLTRDNVENLLPVLQYWIDTGRLPGRNYECPCSDGVWHVSEVVVGTDVDGETLDELSDIESLEGFLFDNHS